MKRIPCTEVEELDPEGYYSHADVEYLHDCINGCCDFYRCRDCGTEFRVELPQ